MRPGGGSSSGGGTIKPLDYWVGNMCVIGYEGTRIGSGCSTRSLEETANKQQDKINKETDTAKRVEVVEQLTLTQARIVHVNEFGRTGVCAQKALQRVYDSEAYQNSTPNAQLKVGKQISSSLARGEIGGPWLQSLANVLEQGFKLQSRSGNELRYPRIPESNQINPHLSQDFRRLGFASAAVMATGQLRLTTPANQTPPPGSGSVAAAVVIGLILIGVEIYTRSQSDDQKSTASDEKITTNDTDKKTPVSAIDEYLAGTTPIRVGDKSDQRASSGGAAQAEKDFEKLVDPSSIRTDTDGVRIGVTPSGQTVVLYPAREGSQTIAFPGIGKDGKQLKVRYR